MNFIKLRIVFILWAIHLPNLAFGNNEFDARWLSPCEKNNEYALCDLRNGRGFLKKEVEPPKGVSINYGDGFIRYIVGGSISQVDFKYLGKQPTLVGVSMGYVNLLTEKIIFPQFSSADRFSNGFARVGMGGVLNLDVLGRIEMIPQLKDVKYAYIDSNGTKITEHIFDDGGRFEEGLAPVKIGDKWGYINTKGKLAIPPIFDEAKEFSEGLAAVKRGNYIDGKWGYITKDGNTVIPFQFTRAEKFSSGRASVSPTNSTNSFGVIDTKGKLVVLPKYYGMILASLNFNEHPLAVRCEIEFNTGCVLINVEGKVISDKYFSNYFYYPYSNGLLIIQENDSLQSTITKTFILDFQGNEIASLKKADWMAGWIYSDNSILFIKDENEKEYYVDLRAKLVYEIHQNKSGVKRQLHTAEYPHWVNRVLNAAKKWDAEKSNLQYNKNQKNQEKNNKSDSKNRKII